jgi:opacity protein-like surface antigen
MKLVMFATTVAMMTAAPLMAQTDRAYVAGYGGFAAAGGTTSADALGEAGVRIAPHLSVIGDIGRFRNLQPSEVQPAIDATTASLADTQGVAVLGTGRVPAWYSAGGLRYDIPTGHRILPYVSGELGFARLMPTATFTFTSGTLPDGSTPPAGFDITSQLVTAGEFTTPAASTAAMFTLGGGVEIPVARHLAVDAGYWFSRVAADTPLNAQGATFGVGYRF